MDLIAALKKDNRRGHENSERQKVFTVLSEHLSAIRKEFAGEWIPLSRFTDALVNWKEKDPKTGKVAYVIFPNLPREERYRPIRQYVVQWARESGFQFRKETVGGRIRVFIALI